MKKAAAYCMTRNLYEVSVPSIKSLLINGGVDIVYLIIEDDEFPVKLPRTKVINMKDQKFFTPGGMNIHSRWTYMAMMRAALAKILKESQVLSLDVDTIIDGDISELWELPLKDYYLAAGIEPHKSKDAPYFNAGVTMFNLSKLRKDGVADKMIEALNTKPYGFIDQDCMNELCAGKILEFDPKYNCHQWAKHTVEDPVIIHYAGYGQDQWTRFTGYQKYLHAEVEK